METKKRHVLHYHQIKESMMFHAQHQCVVYVTQYSLIGIGLIKRHTQKNLRFVGYHNSLLSFDKSSASWKLEIVKDNFTYAITNGTSPFGLQTWHFFNDTCSKELGERVDALKYKKMISFNACNETEFNCKDGTW